MSTSNRKVEMRHKENLEELEICKRYYMEKFKNVSNETEKQPRRAECNKERKVM